MPRQAAAAVGLVRDDLVEDSVRPGQPDARPRGELAICETQVRLRGLQFDDVYGFTWGLNIIGGGREPVDVSFDRYFDMLA